MAPRVLPNLFIIGAPKCGTSSLHFYLSQHPEISMARVKEPYVFDTDDWRSRLPRYADLFDPGARWRGESSTTYSRYPVWGDVPARIHELLPGAKLIYLVGDPVERLISDYVQAVAGGAEHRPIDQALRDFTNPSHYYVAASRYATQIERFLAHFERSSLLVIEQGELRHTQTDVLDEVFRFLELDPGFRSWRFRTEVGTRRDQVRLRRIGVRLRETTAGRAIRSLPLEVREPIVRAARRFLAEKVSRPNLDPGLRAQLIDYLRPEIERLRELTGKSLEHWPDRQVSGSLVS
jgi:sulfotransferase family protein